MTQPETKPPEGGDASSPLPIVAIGASAGGLEALRQLFSRLPAEPDMAFVVIQHLDPDRPSMLARILSGVTSLDVVEAASDMPLERNRVHVIPSGSDLIVRDGHLQLVPREKTGRLHLPIDRFFRSLAEDPTCRAIGVVLSGSGSDGTDGLRAIHAQGGFAMVQEPESAQFTSMPDSAISAGVADFRGSPEDIASELAHLGRHPYIAADAPQVRAPGGDSDAEDLDLDLDGERESALASIFTALRKHAGVDFSGYKRTTLLRRIDRRMALRRIESLPAYASALHDDASEGQALAQDMLIHVTSFFRDPDAFAALEEQVFQQLAKDKEPDETIRIWVAGCATGEEAYALAMGLLEALTPTTTDPHIKIFATDLSEEAIAVARLGVYPEAAMANVPAERRARFFERIDAGYRINRRVRDLCVFVKHDLTRDPPFGKLDLISCRNVLIYFDAELQRRVLPMLHYCLRPDGYLFLGQSEAITGFRDLFAAVDKEHRIFVKTGDSLRPTYAMPTGRETEAKMDESRPPERRQRAREAQRQADHFMLARYAPPGVIINDRLEIIQFRGRTGDYLEPAPGHSQANLLRMARGGLVPHLHEIVERAKAENTTIRKHGLRVQDGSSTQLVDIEVVALTAIPDSSERYFLVLFEEDASSRARDSPAGPHAPLAESATAADDDAERVKAELSATRDFLHSLISEHETVTDELAAANEELVAGNEELQSTNEELQSAKEELQSTNEELSTVNDQLRNRNMELDQVASDLVNVLASVEIPVIIVDLKLRVRRFTPTVTTIARFIPADVGRSIDDIKLRVRVDDLGDRIREVLSSLVPGEWEVQGHEGRWFRLQIRPYRTSDNRLDGAVLSFVDVDALRSAIRDAEAARDYAQSIVETVSTALVVLDTRLRIVSANEAFYQTFDLTAETAAGKSLAELHAGPWEEPALRKALKRGFSHGERIAALELATELAGADKIFSLSARPILWGGGARMLLLAIGDITDLRRLEAEREQLLASEQSARVDAERATHAKDLFLATLSHELRTPLSTMLMSAQLLRHIDTGDARVERASASIERAATSQARLIDDLLDVSRILSGKLMLDLRPVDFRALVQEACDLAAATAPSKGLQLAVELDGAVVYGDPGRLQQIVNNLINNALKFTPGGGRVAVSLESGDGNTHLSISDSGMGIRPDVLPQLFSRFVQADSTVTRTHGGLGLGLSIVRHLVDAHGGEVHAESPGEGQGATFHVTLPIVSASAMPERPVTQPVAYNLEGVRVLLVEDDDDTRESYVAMLDELGAEVRAAPSVVAGLAALREFQPQVILSDIAMPGEDGYTFIQKVRSLKPAQGGQIPAAALTAMASEEDRKHTRQAGFQVHLAKPVDLVKLATVVRRLADQASLSEPVDSMDY